MTLGYGVQIPHSLVNWNPLSFANKNENPLSFDQYNSGNYAQRRKRQFGCPYVSDENISCRCNNQKYKNENLNNCWFGEPGAVNSALSPLQSNTVAGYLGCHQGNNPKPSPTATETNHGIHVAQLRTKGSHCDDRCCTKENSGSSKQASTQLINRSFLPFKRIQFQPSWLQHSQNRDDGTNVLTLSQRDNT